jgi:glycosyltransferase involved in cell wall biosynthesis
MHIGVLTHNYPRFPGDFSGNFVEALCEELVTQGQRVTVLAPWDPAYERQPEDHRVRFQLYRYAPVADWHRLGYMRTMQADVAMRRETYWLAPLLFACGWRAIDRWARREQPDLLHAHWALPNGFLGALVARRLSIPLVVSIPGSDALVAAQNPLFRRMVRFAFDQAGLITANSRSLRDVAVRDLGADPGKFDLVVYGVDPAALTPSQDGVAALREELKIPQDRVILLAVGRMVYKKGFDVLLQAFALLERSDTHLVLIGEGDLWSEWRTLGQELGIDSRLHWMGNVSRDQISTYYNLADVLVMPSVTRPATGLSVCVMDAMACGKPIVASDAAGNPLVVRPEVNGFIVPERDPAALGDALARIVSDPRMRQRMGRASRHLVETEFGWPHVARHYIEQFQRLVHR